MIFKLNLPSIRLSAFSVFTSAVLAFPCIGFAQNSNQLFATINEFTGSVTAPTFVAEIDLNSATPTVNPIFNVPLPPGTDFDTDQARDLLVDDMGNVFLYNGTFDPSLLTRTASTGVITQTTTSFLEFSSINNSTFGGIGRLGDFLFLSDQDTNGSPNQGVVRLDLNTNNIFRFGANLEPQDINIGLDGTLLAIDGAGSPNSEVFRFDPITGNQLSVVSVPFADHRAVAGLADGTFLTARLDGLISHFDLNGNLINSLQVDGANFSDIDIAADGQVALGTASDGDIVLTTTDLNSFQQFNTGNNGDVFVTFATDFGAVPEPSSAALLIGLGIPFALRRRKNG